MKHIALIAKRQEDLHNGHPDYHVYAGAQKVGRIYQTHLSATRDQWFWGVNAVTFDMSLGAVMHGFAKDLDEAKAKLRMAFDEWLVWGQTVEEDDPKRRRVLEELSNMGKTPAQ